MAWDKPFRIPVLGLMMRMFGAFPVNLAVAADASAQREAIELLRKGRALVMFPEGGRTRTGKLMPFKMGAFRLALVACLFALGMAGSGGWFYYNSHVLNRFRTSKQTRELLADYERMHQAPIVPHDDVVEFVDHWISLNRKLEWKLTRRLRSAMGSHCSQRPGDVNDGSRGWRALMAA